MHDTARSSPSSVPGPLAVTRTLDECLQTVAPHARSFERAPGETIRPASDDEGRGAAALEAHLADLRSSAPRYRPDEAVGRGGMGLVLRGLQRSLGREVALKRLRPETSGQPRALRRLLREAWATGLVEHPNVVPVHDLELDEAGEPVLAMKLIDGVAWSEVIDDPAAIAERFGAIDALEWNLRTLVQAMQGLELAHHRGILHRDVKPANVMIGNFGEVYVLDWGLAVSLGDDHDGRLPLARDASQMCGTPAFLPPEMLGGHAELLSQRTDVYGLGGALHVILTGRPPHPAGSLAEIVASVLESRPTLPASCPPELGDICRRALARDPHDRFASVSEMRAAIERFLEHRASHRIAEAAERSLAEMEELLAAPASGDENDRRRRLYGLLGACRFGFRHALTAWPGNASARAALERAVGATIDYELARGHGQAAALLLEDLASPPAELGRRIEALAREEAQRREALERLREDHDPRVGHRRRVALAAFAAGCFVLSGLIGGVRMHVLGQQQAAWELFLWPSTFALGVPAFAALNRAHVRRSAVTRRLLAMLFATFVLMLISHVGMALAGIPFELVQSFDLFLWGGVTSAYALFVDRRLLPSSAAFLAGYLVACQRPDLRFWILTAASVFLALNFLYTRSPWTRERDPLERYRERA